MAKGKKTGGRNFEKGWKGGGRKKLPPDLRAARNMSYEDMCRAIIEIKEMTPEELKQIDLEKISFGQRVIINAFAKMDYRGIKEYEDRLYGKAKETVALTDETDYSKQIKKLKMIREAIKNEHKN